MGSGGGGSSSITIDVPDPININSQSTIDSTSTSTATVNSNSTSNNQIDSTANAQFQIVGLDNIRLRADSNSDSKTAVEMDLKPLQIDFCFKVGLERFPSTKICKPVSRHFGLTFLGVEIMGFNYVDVSTTVIEDLSRQPVVVGEAAQFAPHPHAHHPMEGGPSVRIRVP
jgi:hypothetical protein